jgi:hypothetical protein
MTIEFQLNGAGELPPTTNSAAIPQRGDIIEYLHTDFEVKHIRFRIEGEQARIIVVIERQ